MIIPEKINLNLGENSYPIIIGQDNLAALGNLIQELNLGRDIFLITNTVVAKLYGDTVIKHLRQAGIKHLQMSVIPDGEQAKTIENWHKVLGEIADFDNGLNKRLVVVNLGGGVVGDLGGFVAAVYRRGINFVQVPTTLLANVDSGVGGKVAVNFKQGKNLVGAFYQPRLVFVDLSLLKSLPQAEMRAGLAEVVKYGVIADSELFAFLEQNYHAILQYDLEALHHIVRRSYQIKAQMVEQDERDTKGIRALLNFGHTFGHAIETATNYARYRHGEAVAIGMICAAQLAEELGMFSQGETQRLEALMAKIGLPAKIQGADLAQIMQAMTHDKKFVNKKNRFILPVKIGEAAVKEGIDETLIKKIVARRLE
ncbi:MAG: 3-dehydroquinate synthase [Candidatus Schekmanbacteria bacterium]|nr:3-dehydroquinate synthase [Candidatus Schekmanbacteria bacterium]